MNHFCFQELRTSNDRFLSFCAVVAPLPLNSRMQGMHAHRHKMGEVPKPPTSDDEWFALELVGSDCLFLDIDTKSGSIIVDNKSSEASQVIVVSQTNYCALRTAEANLARFRYIQTTGAKDNLY